MRKGLAILVCLIMPYTLMAQDYVSDKEFGLLFTNFDNFGLTFRVGSSRGMWRFGSTFISGTSRDETTGSTRRQIENSGFGFEIGKEARINLTEDFELRLGGDATFDRQKSKTEITNGTSNVSQIQESITIRLGVQVVFGFNYVINEKLVLGAEILPGARYLRGESSEQNNGVSNNGDIDGFEYGLFSDSARLSLVYRFF